ncbi:hypothetical protein BV898_00303 [Hypsibius exemplaris]|uniref:GATA-type domain-containing protein n=1 Tax=Hypsibius exemplaris TaxID=2072580 RepID=A0A1W0XFD6_HYPEX|nr:hypothetical protein BV898_00303 [Hypsibius exemplaris]
MVSLDGSFNGCWTADMDVCATPLLTEWDSNKLVSILEPDNLFLRSCGLVRWEEEPRPQLSVVSEGSSCRSRRKRNRIAPPEVDRVKTEEDDDPMGSVLHHVVTPTTSGANSPATDILPMDLTVSTEHRVITESSEGTSENELANHLSAGQEISLANNMAALRLKTYTAILEKYWFSEQRTVRNVACGSEKKIGMKPSAIFLGVDSKECANCKTRYEDKLIKWRRDCNNRLLCNKCGLFFKSHGYDRIETNLEVHQRSLKRPRFAKVLKEQEPLRRKQKRILPKPASETSTEQQQTTDDSGINISGENFLDGSLL